jgi:uncharacterized membrane protein YebE (DUF533 family)
MNTKFLLDQLLKSGQTLLREQSSGRHRGVGRQHGRSNPLGDLGGTLGRGFGGGALGSGALALMLGNKRLRKLGGKAAVYGGVAALGVLAYRAYGDWQRQQREGGTAGGVEPRTVDRVSGAEAERHSVAILTAIVAAAKADGHVDERERALIEDEFTRLDDDPDLRRWLEAELRKPADPAEVAAAADSGEMAAEMYLASRMMIDDESYMERAYLDELARCLKLDPELRRRLDQEAAGAASG